MKREGGVQSGSTSDTDLHLLNLEIRSMETCRNGLLDLDSSVWNEELGEYIAMTITGDIAMTITGFILLVVVANLIGTIWTSYVNNSRQSEELSNQSMVSRSSVPCRSGSSSGPCK